MAVHWQTAQALHISRLGARFLVAPSMVLATAMAPSASAQPRADASTVREAPATQGHNEVDRFMKRVFDNRDETWQRLGDFILRETNTFEPEAPAGIALSGYRREYEWYVSDGVAVRSPVRFDGVDVDEERRRDYEEEWLREERRRRHRRDSRPRTVTRRGREDAVATAIEGSWGGR